jgi:hypothetical protein
MPPKLANPPAARSVSDQLDAAMGWQGAAKEQSRVRGYIHGEWHKGAAVVAAVSGDFEKAGAEAARAAEQYSRVVRPPSPPAKK